MKIFHMFFLVLLISSVMAGEYKYQEDIAIYSKDGTKISANMYTPIDSSKTVFPTIIFANSWSLDEYEYIIQAEKFAKKGYLVFSYSSRGWGKSGGMVNVAGEKDMEDLSCCIDWLEKNTAVDVKNIGISGISYGGGMSLLAAAMEPRIKTAAAMSTWGDLGASLYGNQTPRLVWGTILLGSGYLTGNMDPIIIEHYNNLLNNKNVPETLAWAAKRSPITFVDKINEREVPIYISNNLQDDLFQPNSVVELFHKLKGPKFLDINLGIHASAELGGLIGISNYVWNNTHDWFDYWLKGVDTAIMNKPNVNVAVKNTDIRENYTSWPISKAKKEKYYLAAKGKSAQGKLQKQTTKDKKSVDVIGNGILSGISTGIPVIGPIFEAHTPIPIQTWFSTVNTYIAMIYESQELEAPLEIRGIATLDLAISADDPDIQLIAHLYDVDEWNVGTLITHAPITLHNVGKSDVKKVSVDFVATFYNIPKGHKLALAIDTYDLNYSSPNIGYYDVTFHYAEDPVLTVPSIDNSK